MQGASVTSKGQVTIPKAIRDQLGLEPGSRVEFAVVGDHIELRPVAPAPAVPESGFGMIRSRRPPVPPDFDVAQLLRPE